MKTTLHFIFHQGQILLEHLADGTTAIPTSLPHPLGWESEPMTVSAGPTATEGESVVAGETLTDALPSDAYEWIGLRQSYYHLSPSLYQTAGKCSELLFWSRNNRFCGRCGHPMAFASPISKRCSHCGREIWPSPAPAVIVLIHRGDEVLLVHARNFRGKFFGLVAGFVETGESLEEAVVREVREETGLRIHHLRYFGSQPWPYPFGIMMGYHADYLDGQVKLQEEELEAGRWFSRDHLPTIPEKLSIARRLIDDWLAGS